MTRVAVAHGAVSIGMLGQVIEVQAHLSPGLPAMTIVGLPDTAVSESRDRVRAAVASSGFDWPLGRITVGLSPAFEHKRGSGLDLAVAIAVLSAMGVVPPEGAAAGVFLGELGLDGSVRPVPGSVALALGMARTPRRTSVFASATTASQIARVPGIRSVPVAHLGELVHVLTGAVPARQPEAGDALVEDGRAPELSDILGQQRACAALEVAAAGGHHLLLQGPPGVGKTMLAHRLPGLLPALDDDDALEVAAIRDAVDGGVRSVTRVPPFRAPHHSTTHIAMVGGSVRGVTRPGQISLAHHGVLFLDEAAEFNRMTLESLRQPMEDGVITIARAAATERLPARFQLVLAANPCPCGRAGTSGCTCPPSSVRRYQLKLSGPLLDRIDMQLHVGAPIGRQPAEASAVVRGRVQAARDRARARLAPFGEHLNCRVPGGVLRKELPMTSDAQDLLQDWYRDDHMSLRSLDRVARLSWTIADLAGSDRPGLDEVQHAILLRRTTGEGDR